MHQFSKYIENILNKNNPSIQDSFLDLIAFYEKLENEEQCEFIDNIWYLFRNFVHNISREDNYLFNIESILYFHEKGQFNNIIVDSNDIICFSFPLRHQVYSEDCYFSKNLIDLYALFFEENNIFIKHNKYKLSLVIREIKEFIKVGFNKNDKQMNKLFSNKVIFNYFYNNEKEWLKTILSHSKFSVIKNKILIEEF